MILATSGNDQEVFRSNITIQLEPEVLLHPSIPDPLHGVAPRAIMGNSQWKEIAARVNKRQDYFCISCGVHKDDALRANGRMLDCHELYEVDYDNYITTLKRYIGLCVMCHAYIHIHRLAAMVTKGIEKQEYFDQVVAKGDRLMKKNNLFEQRTEMRKFCESKLKDYDNEFGLWKLKFRNHYYTSPITSREDYINHYNKEVVKPFKPVRVLS